MKTKLTAILASLTVLALGLGAQAKKPKAPAAPAKPAVAAPAAPAAPAPAAPAAAAEEPAAPAEGFFVKSVKAGDGKDITLKLGGYVDTYYAFHSQGGDEIRAQNHPNGTGGANGGTDLGSSATRGTNGRIFEGTNQQFTLGLVQTKFEIGNEDWQVVADLVHGPNAELTNFNNLRGGSSSTTSTAIKQAYVAGNLAKGLKLTAGQFGTHIGYEVVESYQNANYMLGYLFGYGPFYHTGAKLDYAISDKIAVMAGVVNGWDLQYDNNKNKTVIAQVTLKPISELTVILNYAGGNETNTTASGSAATPPVADAKGMRHIGDVVVQYQVSKMIKVGANFVYGEEKVNEATAAQKWGGAAGYLSVTPIDGFTLSYRLDYFEDKMRARGLLGVTGGTSNGATVMGHTLTGTISMYGGHFLIRPEVKYDRADLEVFGFSAEKKKDNVTALIAFTGVY
ncbi:MAG TPA: outer membrane beta-barrel protein [Turneriella sp.]|nr:outer membrane beta-barrel protein [Turneriella sp.]